mmetsp:Transcript_20104/g.28031  ORF Transcript_20104/g.28031 Transcript_20104/m.28031 type:complete len:151 (-) Transcript_20104:3927-4379(-)
MHFVMEPYFIVTVLNTGTGGRNYSVLKKETKNSSWRMKDGLRHLLIFPRSCVHQHIRITYSKALDLTTLLTEQKLIVARVSNEFVCARRAFCGDTGGVSIAPFSCILEHLKPRTDFELIFHILWKVRPLPCLVAALRVRHHGKMPSISGA